MKKIFLLLLLLITIFAAASCDSNDDPTGVQSYDPPIVIPTKTQEQVFVFDNGLQYVIDSDISCHIVGIGDFKGEVLTIPGSDSEGRIVSYIADYAFKNCTDIKIIRFDEGITEICGGAFQGCTSLEEISLPESLRSIATFAFYGCSSLKSVYITQNITKIGQNAFACCSGLEAFEVDEFNESYISVDGVLYSNDMKVLNCYPTGKTTADFIIPDGVERINNAAFEENPYIVSVKTPTGFTEIDDHAFRNCTELAEVYLADTLTRIGVGAFYQCTALDSVYYAGSEEMWKEADDDDDEYVELANTWKSGAGKCELTYDFEY